MRTIIWLLFFIGVIQSSLAQSDIELKVHALFEEDQPTLEVQYFHGRMDAMQEVGMALGCIDKDCRGVLRYIRSKEELLLKGTIKKEELTLEEINNFGKKSGNLSATLTNNSIEGWWTDPAEENYSPFKLLAVNKIPLKATPCGKEKWIRYFSSPDNKAHIFLQKSGDSVVEGWMFLPERNKNLILEGGTAGDGYYELQVFEDHNVVGSLIGSFKAQGAQNVLFEWEGGEKNQMQFISSEKLIYGCIEYGDFLSYFSMTYPLTRHQSFNTWMEKKVSAFASESKKYGADVRKENPELNPAMRSSIHANAWTEINYYNKGFISGILNFSNNWKEQESDESFIFNFKDGKLLTKKELFKISSEVEKLVNNRKLGLIEIKNGDENYNAWIAADEFELINIQYNGLSFASAFHPIFGREKIVLTFEELSPYLNTNGGISALVK